MTSEADQLKRVNDDIRVLEVVLEETKTKKDDWLRPSREEALKARHGERANLIKLIGGDVLSKVEGS